MAVGTDQITLRHFGRHGSLRHRVASHDGDAHNLVGAMVEVHGREMEAPTAVGTRLVLLHTHPLLSLDFVGLRSGPSVLRVRQIPLSVDRLVALHAMAVTPSVRTRSRPRVERIKRLHFLAARAMFHSDILPGR